MADARCFVFPSYYEGFGLPVLESFAAKTPVITSINSSMAEFAYDSALLVDPNKVEQITEAIKNVLTLQIIFFYR